MLPRALTVAILMMAACACTVQAQSSTCRIIEVPGSNTNFMNPGTPQETVIITGGAHIVCGSRVLRADQATRIAASQRIELFGNVRVEDVDRIMTADQATFYGGTRQLAARINVVIRDRRTGSWIRGDLVDYYQATDTRSEPRIEARSTTGSPARAVLVPAPDTAAAANPTAVGAADSTVVDASQITITGEQSFTAIGGAVMTRDSMRASGQTIEYAQETGELLITRDGMIDLPRQRMRGDSINVTVGAGNELTGVLTRHGASIESEEMDVTAPAIRLEFEDGGITRMVAMRWAAAAGAAVSARPRVEAEQFLMESDSIDVRAPGQQLTEAIAIGDAYGERIAPDSLQGLLPEMTPDLQALVSSDWMRGDTVRATFVARPALADEPAVADEPVLVDEPAADRRVLERLTAAGSPAVSVYRMLAEDAEDQTLSINYLTASRIEVVFTNGTVSVVSAAGDARGMYLQPTPVAGAAPAGGGSQREQP